MSARGKKSSARRSQRRSGKTKKTAKARGVHHNEIRSAIASWTRTRDYLAKYENDGRPTPKPQHLCFLMLDFGLEALQRGLDENNAELTLYGALRAVQGASAWSQHARRAADRESVAWPESAASLKRDHQRAISAIHRESGRLGGMADRRYLRDRRQVVGELARVHRALRGPALLDRILRDPSLRKRRKVNRRNIRNDLKRLGRWT